MKYKETNTLEDQSKIERKISSIKDSIAQKTRIAFFAVTSFFAVNSTVLSKDIDLHENNNMEAGSLDIPDNMRDKILEAFFEIMNKNDVLKYYSNEYLVYNMFTKYWEETDDNFKDFQTSMKQLIEKKYKNGPKFNASRQMLLDIGLTPEKLKAVYPLARKTLVNRYGHQGDNPKSAEEYETYLPEEFTNYLSPNQVFKIGMFACQGDDKELSKDMFEIGKKLLKDDFEKYAVVKYQFGDNIRSIKFKISENGITDIHFKDGKDPVPDSIQQALVNIIPDQETNIVSNDKEEAIHETEKISHQEKDIVKNNFLTRINDLGINLNNKPSQKMIATVLAKKDFQGIVDYAKSFNTDNTIELISAMYRLSEFYRPSIDMKNEDEKIIENSDGSGNTLFAELLEAKRGYDSETTLEKVPNQWGMQARYKELKKAKNVDDIINVLNKIIIRNPNIDRSKLFSSMMQYHISHKAWMEVHGEEYKRRLAENTKNIRNNIGNLVA